MCCYWIIARILTIVTAGGRRAFNTMKKYTVKRIDRRYNGSHFAQYRIYINDQCDSANASAKIDLFRNMRDWCTETWGHSCEARYHGYLQHQGYATNPHWAWENPGKFNQFYLFLASDVELTFFQLRWPTI
jgi:hypothetical protein